MLDPVTPPPPPPPTLKLLVLDVDGVLTDGQLYYHENGETLKVFHVLDGHGLKLLQSIGMQVAVISGRDGAALRCRLQHLGIEHVFLGQTDKRPAVWHLLKATGLDSSQMAVMGDDWPDLPLMQMAQWACCPPTAHVEVRQRVHHITQAAAGRGAVREVCDLILQAKGHYASELARYWTT